MAGSAKFASIFSGATPKNNYFPSFKRVADLWRVAFAKALQNQTSVLRSKDGIWGMIV